MKAEQGIEIFNAIKLQMNSVEQAKFEEMMLNQVESKKQKLAQYLEKFNKKHNIKQIKNL